jgi:hypothetical protein
MDEYWECIREYWPTIHRAYSHFADRRPVILVVIDESRVYAYPRDEFKKELSPRSQASLDEQYAAADSEGEIVVFVRDDTKRRLVSYSCPWGPPTRGPNRGAARDRGHRAVRTKRERARRSRGA